LLVPQTTAPLAAAKVPAVQSEQPAAGSDEALPTAHARQAVAPMENT
jgi:hypothetical protein